MLESRYRHCSQGLPIVDLGTLYTGALYKKAMKSTTAEYAPFPHTPRDDRCTTNSHAELKRSQNRAPSASMHQNKGMPILVLQEPPMACATSRPSSKKACPSWCFPM